MLLTFMCPYAVGSVSLPGHVCEALSRMRKKVSEVAHPSLGALGHAFLDRGERCESLEARWWPSHGLGRLCALVRGVRGRHGLRGESVCEGGQGGVLVVMVVMVIDRLLLLLLLANELDKSTNATVVCSVACRVPSRTCT